MADKGTATWLDRKNPNALNLFRLILASLVIVAHAWNLKLSEDPLRRLPQKSDDFGTIAVNGFFIISGFLIVGSWMSRRSADQFLQARILRIWPGFAVALVVSIGFGMLGADGISGAIDYLKGVVRPPGRFLESFLLLEAGFLNSPAVFQANPFPGAVNGSLWTISYEFACYLAVAFLGVVGLVKRRGAMLAIIIAWLIAFWAMALSGKAVDGSWARFAAYFAAGSFFAIFADRIPDSRMLAIGCALGLVASLFIHKGLQLVGPVLAPYLIFYLAFHAPEWMRAIGSKTDISYGVYLYAFPMQQLFYHWEPTMAPLVNMLLTLAWALVAGWLSYHLVEKPAMRLKSASV